MMDKTFDPAAVEARISTRWDEAQAFKAGREDRSDAVPYTIVIPPPNVTGSLHMGHALNNTIQDILCRFERMRGRDVLWQPGMDHAGIATQMVVERQLDGAADPSPRTRPRGIRQARLGVEGRIRRHASRPAAAPRRLLRLVARALHHGRGPVPRRPQGVRRSLRPGPDLQGQAPRQLGPQVPDRDLRPRGPAGRGEGQSLAYPLSPSRATPERFITVATTRPETMLGDVAVAVHPDDERYRRSRRQVRDPAAGRPPHSRSWPTNIPTRRRAPARSRSRPRTISTTSRSASATTSPRSTFSAPRRSCARGNEDFLAVCRIRDLEP